MAATATSLEILEECFERIYTTRKNVLASKHRSFMRTEDKRKRGKLTTPARQQRGGGSPTRGGGMGARGNLGDTLTRLQESDDDNDEVGNSHHHLTPPPPKRGTGGAKSSTVAPKVIGSHQELNPNDLTATVVFDEFRTELIAWVTERLHAFQSPAHAGKAPQAARKEYLEACADCADYMTDKYLCQRLDPLHASEVVSKVRKTLSKVIEDFAQAGELPADFEEIRFYEIVGAEGDDMGGGARYLQKLAQKSDAEAAALARGQKSSKSSLASALGMKSLGNGIAVSPGGGVGLGPGGAPVGSVDSGVASFGLSVPRAKAATKEEKEKARIKEQYAHFLAKKRDAVQAEPSSSSTASGAVGDLVGQARDALAMSIDAPAAAPAARAGGGGGGEGPPSSLTALSAHAATGRGGHHGQGYGPGAGHGSGAGTGPGAGPAPGGVEEEAKAAELEGLNNDIRSLLSSIQGKSLGEKLALTAPAAARK